MIKHSRTVPFSEEDRRHIIEDMDYYSVYEMARQYMGGATSDKNIFLAQACNYHAQRRRLQLDCERGLNRSDIPAPHKSGARNFAHHVRVMNRVLDRMARNLIIKGRAR